ncbi:MAG: hypothetical protein QM541_17210, partial [Flavobacterium sp.]|nr:hypothetical protein [Flavobacterium sp.]
DISKGELRSVENKVTIFFGDIYGFAYFCVSCNAKTTLTMNILLLIDDKFEIDRKKLNVCLSSNCKHLKFKIFENAFTIDEEILSKPKSFDLIREKYGLEFANYDRVFCFTDLEYNDNFFIHEHNNLSIFSFAYWSLLTDLPKSNGLIYFIVDYLALDIDPTDFRHNQTTGCIYDFLGDKRGIDAGMRQARLCPNCLKRISDSITDDETEGIFNDIKTLMDLLSASSRWNKDIFNNVVISKSILDKRNAKSEKGISVVIASPGDTQQERKLLLDTLERKFRTDNHEGNCGFRILVSGWEDLASQNGYAQDVINAKLIQESDFVVSVFKHKLGTPTFDQQTGLQRAESGTVEELLQALDNSKATHPIGMAYFFSTAPVISLDTPDFDKIATEWKRLIEFRKTISTKIIFKPYTEPSELLNTVLKDLEQNIKSYILK